MAEIPVSVLNSELLLLRWVQQRFVGPQTRTLLAHWETQDHNNEIISSEHVLSTEEKLKKTIFSCYMPPSDVDKDNQENFPYDAAPPSLPRVQ